MNKKTQNLYRYKDCGLDYIYLANGYEVINDPEFGKAVSIHNLDGLNKAIAKGVIEHVSAFRGQEARFFRSLLKLSQTEMGILLGCNLRTVQRWEEEKRNDTIPPTADRFLRLFYAAYADGKEVAHQVCEYLKEAQGKIDPVTIKKGKAILVPRIELADTGRGWKAAA